MKKKEKLLRDMSLLDERYVEEADPTRIRRNKKARLYRMSALAACIAILAVSISLWLFIPFNTALPDVSMYADSEYYEIIQKLNEITYYEPTDKNNFEKYVQNFIDGMFMAKAESDGAMEPTSGTPGEYVEVTDNQVQGVIEGDLFKRTTDRAFYLNGNTLQIFSIEGEDSREIGRHMVDTVYAAPGAFYYNMGEMYLSPDGNIVTLIYPYSINSKGAQVAVITLDVSDPENVQEKSVFNISGEYISSRSVNGRIFLVSGFYVGRNPDFSDESNFLPQITVEGETFSVPVGDIIVPNLMTSPRYTVICEFDQESLSFDGCTALLSYSNSIYVSDSTIYATRGYQDRSEQGTLATYVDMTEISALDYLGEGFTLKGTATVAGSVKDQYSLDEYDGMLRVVTTTNMSQYNEEYNDEGTKIGVVIKYRDTNASLYILDSSTMELLTSVEHFAPEGESVRSVRFDGTAAYICTSVELSDPVFFFDLSDIDHITSKDTGTIAGFSSSLVNFGEGLLLGIGRGETWSSVKVEVYEEYGDEVIPVCAYEVASGFYTEDYKTYYINREEKLIGLAINDYNKNESNYVLLHFDNYDLHVVESIPVSGSFNWVRAFMDDGYLYLFYQYGFEVERVGY
ncbi:MAG: beta-propeller domain-containing protein [Clostridia bacterium]|nr:beta-propeller domain-containing protein [Clostridia bacterium]